MSNFQQSRPSFQKSSFQNIDIPSITVTDWDDSTSSSESEEESSDNDKEINTSEGTTKKVKEVPHRGPNYLKTRKDYKQSQTVDTDFRHKNLLLLDEFQDSTEWETEEDEPEVPPSSETTKTKRDPFIGSETSQGQKDNVEVDIIDFDDLFNPGKFGYVNLSNKVLIDYELRMEKTVRRNIERNQFGSPKLNQDYLDNFGGDYLLPPPMIVLEKSEKKESDPLGLKNVEEILNSPDLTISQKYRSLGVDEDPLDEPGEEGGCWEWLKYKLNGFYLSQWPLGNGF